MSSPVTGVSRECWRRISASRDGHIPGWFRIRLLTGMQLDESWDQTTRTARDTRFEQEETGTQRSDLLQTAIARSSADEMMREISEGA